MNLKTGYENLDNVIGSLENRKLYTIASRPGVGKTTLALNIANFVSKQANDKILYFTLETSRDLLKTRITSENIEIIDNARITVEEIKSKCEEVAKKGLSLVVIDYIQLIHPTTFNTLVLDDIKHSSEVLKEISIDLNIPIIILSQLTKQQAKTLEDDSITSFDYQDNSPLLQHTDKIIFLYRESYYKSKEKLTTTEDNNYFKDVKVLHENIVIVVIP
ncbi:MAG: hypothetical protein OSJ63_03980 [Bacilli bacterium]|nr:hypothetical protein [Bacilli bacterium]